MDVSIIMINYNTYELTKNALNSIYSYTKDLSYEIILIDNDSPDLSGEKLAVDFDGKIKYIQNAKNEGTSKAFNKCLEVAFGKYVLWLNTDIILFDNFIKKLFEYMENNSNCGICGGNVINVNKQPAHSFKKELITLKSIKKENAFLRKILNRVFHRPFYDQYNFTDSPMQVGYVTGADMMIRKDLLDDIGGFNEEIFMYAEEVEFTYRMKQETNYTAMVIPYAKIIHLDGASSAKSEIKSFNGKRIELMLTGNAKYFKLCFGNDEAIRYLDYMIKITKAKRSMCFFIKSKKDYYERYLETIKIVKSDFLSKK